MAEAVFQRMVDEAGLAEEVGVDSAGTGNWHVGERAHRGTRAVLREHGIDYDGRARQVTAGELDRFDYVIAMDGDNASDLRRLDRQGRLDGRLYRLLDFAPPGSPRDVPDPYYEGNFDYVYRLVASSSRNLLEHIRREQGL